MTKYIDITMPIRTGMAHWPGDPSVAVEPVGDVKTGRVSRISLGTHTGTHIDSPRHLLHRGAGIEKTPPEHLIGPCVVIACRGREFISLRDVQRADLGSTPRVLFRTENSKRRVGGRFPTKWVGLAPEAARWLAGHGAYLVGVDGPSVDGPKATGLECHNSLLRAGVTVVEGLCLKNAPEGVYELICLPLLIPGCDGAPARAFLKLP